MIRKDGGVQLVECDNCGVQQEDDFFDGEFQAMIDNAKARGWMVRPDVHREGGWTHLCKSCKPTGIEAQRALLGLPPTTRR